SMKPEPEAGKLVPKRASARNLFLVHIPAAHDQGARLLKRSLHESGHVVCTMPPVGIDTDGISATALNRFPETTPQRIPSAPVTAVLQHNDPLFIGLQDLRRGVCRPVIDHYRTMTIRPRICQYLLQYPLQCAGIVV